MSSRAWDNPDADPLGDVLDFVQRAYDQPRVPSRYPYLVPSTDLVWDGADSVVSWASIYRSDMDKLTHQLEKSGHVVWFTCEVDGTEYRLAARKDHDE